MVVTTMAMVGCAEENQASQIARRSSPRLSAQLLSGSGDMLAAARALAFVPCEVSAMPPARSAAAQRQGSGAAAVALKANRAAAGGRMKVCTACQTESMYGTLSARNSITYRTAAMPRTMGLEST